jgi:hypothetical protein
MKSNALLRRRDDGKLFRVIRSGHWITIQSCDGVEEDYVKYYGDGPDGAPAYAGATSGYAYVLVSTSSDETD